MASEFSILDAEFLTETIKGDIGQNHYYRKDLKLFLKNTIFSKCIKYETITDQSPFKRVTTQALDFDWIFEEDNATRFVKILNNSADDKFLDKKSIKVLIELLWNYYKPIIVGSEFMPYCIYTILWIHFIWVADHQYLACTETYYEAGTIKGNECSEHLEYVDMSLQEIGMYLQMLIVTPFIYMFWRREYL